MSERRQGPPPRGVMVPGAAKGAGKSFVRQSFRGGILHESVTARGIAYHVYFLSWQIGQYQVLEAYLAAQCIPIRAGVSVQNNAFIAA